MRNFGINEVITGVDGIPLFYDEHAAIDRPFTLGHGESVTRGDLVYFQAQGEDFSEPVAAEANVGDGTMVVDAFNEGGQLGSFTIVYTDGVGWEVTVTTEGGSAVESSANATGQFLVGTSTVTITAGDIPFETGDTFTMEIYETGSPHAYKASTLAHLGTANGVLVVGRDTDATNGPEPTFGYASGVFNQNAIGNWDTIVADAGEYDDVITALGLKGIHVKEGLK